MARPHVPSGLLVFAAAVLAGCLGGVGDPFAPDGSAGQAPYSPEASRDRLAAPDVDFTTAISPDHGGLPDGHAVAALHMGGHGLELVGYHPLTRPLDGDAPTAQDSGFIAIDTWHQYVCVAHFIGTGGATIVDIADPAKPVVVSSVDSGMVNSDCQFTDDGRHLLLAAYTGVTEGDARLPPPAGDAAAIGVLVYDVSDKRSPKFLFHDTQGAGGDGYHNVFTANIGGTDYVFQTFTGNILALDPGASKLRRVAEVEAAVHDIWVGRHPVTGDWMMVTGAGGGTRVYNVNDPANPEPLGEWDAHDGFTGWHRQWPLENTVGGRAYMVVAGEDCGFFEQTGATLPYTVLDWTDPLDLVEVGHWQVPGNPRPPPPNFCTMSPHEFESWDGYVATGNYHAGVWLIDIGTPERASAPATLGYYQPHEIPAAALGTWNKPFAFNPDVWGAYFDERGYVVTADWGTGLYVLKFGATRG